MRLGRSESIGLPPVPMIEEQEHANEPIRAHHEHHHRGHRVR